MTEFLFPDLHFLNKLAQTDFRNKLLEFRQEQSADFFELFYIQLFTWLILNENVFIES